MKPLIWSVLFAITALCCSGCGESDRSAPIASQLPVRSPDGQFEIVSFTMEEVEKDGKPPFGIVETGSGELVWSSPEGHGDAERPEEVACWSPDSKRISYSSRVGSRYISTFIIEFDGDTFSEVDWGGAGELEKMCGERILAAAHDAGFGESAKIGQTIFGETVPVRWIDFDTLLVERKEEATVVEGENTEGFSVSVHAEVGYSGTDGFILKQEVP